MSNEVYLKNTEVLTDLRASVVSFDERSRSALLRVGPEIEAMRSWLAERKAHWQLAVRRAEQDLLEAEAALSSCEASGYYDEDSEGRREWIYPNCGGEQDLVWAARNQLRDDQERLWKVEDWERRCECATAEFEKSENRFRALILDRTSQAVAFLESKISQYEDIHRGLAAPLLQYIKLPQLLNNEQPAASVSNDDVISLPIKVVSPQSAKYADEAVQKLWADEHLHPNKIALSPEERVALGGYQCSDYNPINKALREEFTISPELKRKIAAIDSAIQKSSLPVEMVVFRGTDYIVGQQMRAGKQLAEKGFSSTSLSYDVARSKDFGKGTIIEITIPKGAKGIYLDELRKPFGKEVELLLPRDTLLWVTHRSYIGDTYYIRATIDLMHEC